MGARIIFSPAFWSKFSTDFSSVIDKYHTNDELQAIKYLVPARSIENEVIFVFANAAEQFHVDARKDTLLGYTQICQPFAGPIELYAHNKEKLMIQTIETEIVDEM